MGVPSTQRSDLLGDCLGKRGASQGSLLRVAPPVQKILRSTITSVWGGAQESQSGFLDGGVGRGGAGGVVQFFDKVVDVLVVWVFFVFFVVAAQLLDKTADVPVAVPPRFLFGVKCVGDVLTGR